MNDSTHWLKTKDSLVTFFVGPEGVTVRHEYKNSTVTQRLTHDKAREEWVSLLEAGAVEVDTPTAKFYGPLPDKFYIQ